MLKGAKGEEEIGGGGEQLSHLAEGHRLTPVMITSDGRLDDKGPKSLKFM